MPRSPLILHIPPREPRNLEAKPKAPDNPQTAEERRQFLEDWRNDAIAHPDIPTYCSR